MSTGLMKGIILGAVAGLIIGFTGGYYGQNLDAKAPITGDTAVSSLDGVVNFASLEGDESGLYGDVIMTGIGEGLIKYITDKGNGNAATGVDKIIGSSVSGSFKLNKTDTRSILNFGVEKALASGHAFARECSSVEFDWAEKAVIDAYAFSYVRDVCTESIKLEGTLTVSIYEFRENPDGARFIEFSFKGRQTKVSWQRDVDGNCVKVIESIDVSKEGIIGVSELGNATFIDNLPPGLKAVCTGTTTIDLIANNPKFDKEKCCSKVGPTPDITGVAPE